ncbi:MAG: chorismate mutase [Massiliimalia sp.]|jgi:chorismate mutase/prephenate dehydratase
MDLKECREQIDHIDQQLLHLFLERMDVVTNVAEYKKRNGLPILNAQREKEVIENKLKDCPETAKEYVESFFVHLMEISKCYQLSQLKEISSFPIITGSICDSQDSRIACQGTKGAYSHITAKRLFPSGQIQFYNTFREVFEAVTNQTADYGILPIENSSAGSVCDVYDLLKEYGLSINLIYRLKVEHCLAAKSGVALDQLKRVYSKKEALEQCSRFLTECQIPTENYANTALAAQYVAESQESEQLGAICSEECAQIFHLDILKRQIQNISDNYTKFIVISRNLLVSDKSTETGLCIRIPNQPGELNKLLTTFSLYNIDLSRIESRPIGDKEFSVLFYLSFSGSIADHRVQELISDLQYHYDFVKLLGSYENR